MHTLRGLIQGYRVGGDNSPMQRDFQWSLGHVLPLPPRKFMWFTFSEVDPKVNF